MTKSLRPPRAKTGRRRSTTATATPRPPARSLPMIAKGGRPSAWLPATLRPRHLPQYAHDYANTSTLTAATSDRSLPAAQCPVSAFCAVQGTLAAPRRPSSTTRASRMPWRSGDPTAYGMDSNMLMSWLAGRRQELLTSLLSVGPSRVVPLWSERPAARWFKSPSPSRDRRD